MAPYHHHAVSTLAAIAVGVYITYRVSRHHFRHTSGQQEEVATLETSKRLQAQAEKASAELKARADRLHLVVTVLALDMERDGLLTGVERDERGLLKGVPQVVYPARCDEPEDGQRTPPSRTRVACCDPVLHMYSPSAVGRGVWTNVWFLLTQPQAALVAADTWCIAPVLCRL
jgi:hypothetical protein